MLVEVTEEYFKSAERSAGFEIRAMKEGVVKEVSNNVFLNARLRQSLWDICSIRGMGHNEMFCSSSLCTK